ncbi:hypothetical protein BC826DRAFT_46122 [Russula brevipes]|nr:hypothetical protein BC826DRAFT_46122 [Russula brevipes]
MTVLQNGLLHPDLTTTSSPNHHAISTKQPTPSIYMGPSSSHPTNALPDLAVPGTVSPSTYLRSHTTSTATPLNDSMNPPQLHPYFSSHSLGDGLPSQQRALLSQQCCISLNRSHSAPDIRLVAAQPSSRHLFSNSTEARYQQQWRSSRHGVTTDLPSLNPELVSVAPSPSSTHSATSSTRVYRRAEEWSTMPTSGVHTWNRC